MKPWIEALRLPAGLFTAFTVFASFNLAGLDYKLAIMPAIVTITIFSATVALNDWHDRHRDSLAGKTFASDKGETYESFCSALCLLAVGSVALIREINGMLLSILMIFFGFTYHKTEKVTGLSMVIVAITTAIPALFPLTVVFSLASILVAVFIVVIMNVREIFKDFKDVPVDSHPTLGKATLPVKIGTEKSIVVIRIGLIIASGLLSALISCDSNPLTHGLLTFSMILMIAIVLMIYNDQKNIETMHLLLDIALGIAAIATGILWPIFH